MIQCIEYLNVEYAASLSPSFSARRTGKCETTTCQHMSVYGVRIDRGEFKELCADCKDRLHKRFMEWK